MVLLWRFVPRGAEYRGPMRFNAVTRGFFAIILSFLALMPAGFAYALPDDAQKMELRPEAVMRLRQQYCDPFLAGVLSGMHWGLGHFYAKEYGRASLFAFGDLVYKGMAIGLVIKLRNKYIGPEVDSVQWRDISGTDKGLVIGAAAVWMGLTAFSIYDATKVAKRQNARIDALLRMEFSVHDYGGAPVFSLGWKTPF